MATYTRAGLFGAVAAYLGFSAKASAPVVTPDEFVIALASVQTVYADSVSVTVIAPAAASEVLA